jgi:hypothetical protein
MPCFAFTFTLPAFYFESIESAGSMKFQLFLLNAEEVPNAQGVVESYQRQTGIKKNCGASSIFR